MRPKSAVSTKIGEQEGEARQDDMLTKHQVFSCEALEAKSQQTLEEEADENGAKLVLKIKAKTTKTKGCTLPCSLSFDCFDLVQFVYFASSRLFSCLSFSRFFGDALVSFCGDAHLLRYVGDRPLGTRYDTVTTLFRSHFG